MGPETGHCLQSWFSKLLGSEHIPKPVDTKVCIDMVDLGWLKLVPYRLAASAFPTPSKGVWIMNESFLSHYQISKHMLQSMSPCLILPYFMNIPIGLDEWVPHSVLLWTTITFRIIDLGKARFPTPPQPCSSPELAWDLPQGVTHECTQWYKRSMLYLTSFFCLLGNSVLSHEYILLQADNPPQITLLLNHTC